MNTGIAYMDFNPNSHQKSHSIHIQVNFQEITVLCLYIYVLLSCKGFYFVSTYLFCNYPNCARVYSNYKKFNRVWGQIGQVNFILHFLSPALSQSQSFKFWLYPSSLQCICALLYFCLYHNLNFHLMTTVIILWSENTHFKSQHTHSRDFLCFKADGSFFPFKILTKPDYFWKITISKSVRLFNIFFLIFKIRQNIWFTGE